MERDLSPALMRGNCLDLLSQLPEAGCDMLLTDPPYGTTNLQFDQARIDWASWWKQVHRVCKPTAILACFAAQPFATDLIQSNRRYFRYDLIWVKTNAVGYLSANVRPLRGHEHILIFCRRFGRVLGQIQSVYNPQFVAGSPYVHSSRVRPAAHYSAVKDIGTYRNPGTRHPTSVLRFGRDVKSYHPTQKPLDLCRWLIRAYSRTGERVFDPFMGGGNIGIAALEEGRRFTGMELDEEYFGVASERIMSK